MAEKTLGYVELEWTCENCGTKNPGTQKTCVSCGAPMSEQQKFELPGEQKLITDEKKLEEAMRGPDIHCPYCNARNPGGAEVCIQCGGDLKEGKARESGQVLGAFTSAPAPEIKCPACGSPNAASAARCAQCGASLVAAPAPAPAAAPVQPSKTAFPMLAVIIVGLLCIGGVIILVLGSRKHDVNATVQAVNWERSIQVLEIRPVEHEDWQDELPAEADLGTCSLKYRFTQDQPAPIATEVCGTPYTKDEGSGVGKVVQDCEYRVYDDWCTYTLQEWTVIDTAAISGSDLNPQWPALSLSSAQREGERAEKLRVTFSGDGETYQYSVSDAGEFTQFSPGSQWTLKVNAFGAVTDAIKK